MKFLSRVWSWFLLLFALIPEKKSKDFDFSKSDILGRGPKE